jgi:hypothetical protein
MSSSANIPVQQVGSAGGTSYVHGKDGKPFLAAGATRH